MTYTTAWADSYERAVPNPFAPAAGREVVTVGQAHAVFDAEPLAECRTPVKYRPGTAWPPSTPDVCQVCVELSADAE